MWRRRYKRDQQGTPSCHCRSAAVEAFAKTLWTKINPASTCCSGLAGGGSERHPLTGSQKAAKQNGPTWLLWFEVQLHKPYLEALPLPRAPGRTSCSFSTIKKKNHLITLPFFFSLKQPEHLEFDTLWLPVFKQNFLVFKRKKSLAQVLSSVSTVPLFNISAAVRMEDSTDTRLWGRQASQMLVMLLSRESV